VTCALVAVGGSAIAADGAPKADKKHPIVTKVTDHTANARVSTSQYTTYPSTGGNWLEVIGGGLLFVFGVPAAAVAGAGALLGDKRTERTLRLV